MRLLAFLAGGFITVVLAGCAGGDDRAATEMTSGPPARIPTASVITDQGVEAIAVASNTVYAGGYINYVGPRTGSLAFFSDGSQHPESGWPPIMGADGDVVAVVSDGSGGWVVGGSFESVGGRACPRLAHLTHERVLDRRFCLAPDAPVSALAINGPTVFVGGEFHRIGGRPRLRIAALDLDSARVLPWRAGVTGRPYEARGGNDYAAPSVMTLAFDRGTLFVGGFFERIGGVPRMHLAALDAETAHVLPWRADAKAESPGGYVAVDVLAVGDQDLYVAGRFATLAGYPAAGAGAVSIRSGERTRWNPRTESGYVTALAFADGVVYLANVFSIVAVDAETGAAKMGFASKSVTSESSTPTVNTLVVVGGRLYIGGQFSRIGSVDRSQLAALDRRSGRVLAWAPRANASVRVLAAAGGAIAAGGDFSSVGGVRRYGLVAIDGQRGRVLRWAPRMDGAPTALAVTKSRLFVGGMFTTVNGKKRPGLAAFDLMTQQLTDWAPKLVGYSPEVVRVLGATDETVYVGGLFDSANGEYRKGLAAFDAESGSTAPWNPDLDREGKDGPTELYALAATNASVFIAGNFVRIGDVTRDGLAELDNETGKVKTWNPTVGSWDPALYEWSPFVVTALENVDDVLYIGGSFSSFEEEPRQNLAAVDADTHGVVPWDPALGAGWVGTQADDIAATGELVAVVGDFREAGGQPHTAIALIDRTTGSVLPWRPPLAETPQCAADSVGVSPTVLAFDGYAGGNADSITVYPFTPAS